MANLRITMVSYSSRLCWSRMKCCCGSSFQQNDDVDDTEDIEALQMMKEGILGCEERRFRCKLTLQWR